MSEFDANLPEDLFAVGATDETSVRLWFRTATPGHHRVTISPRGQSSNAQHADCAVFPAPGQDGTVSRLWPDDFENVPPLVPGTAYRVSMSGPGGRIIGRGGFETAPRSADTAPDRFAIAVMSCNQPFDESGALRVASLRELDTLEEVFETHAVKRVVLLGDQMYTDLPRSHSLFDEGYFARIAPPGRRSIFECSREEVRSLYQRRYRAFWKPRAFQQLQANRPCYPIMDDHELVDNFGSSPEHTRAPWLNLREGALDACFDYQSRRLFGDVEPRPQSLHSSFVYGPLAAFVMDLRSERRADAERIEVYGRAQLGALRAFLREHADKPLFLLGLSVPLAHVPDWLADIGARYAQEPNDPADRWSFEKANESRQTLLRVLSQHQAAHPGQRLVLLGGDIHAGMVSRLTWSDPPVFAWQLVSSPVSNLENRMFRLAAQLVARVGVLTHTMGDDFGCRMELAHNQLRRGRNPFSGLNVGLVCLQRGTEGYRARLKLVTHDDSFPPRPRIVFESADF